jgi:hypothetical protein
MSERLLPSGISKLNDPLAVLHTTRNSPGPIILPEKEGSVEGRLAKLMRPTGSDPPCSLLTTSSAEAKAEMLMGKVTAFLNSIYALPSHTVRSVPLLATSFTTNTTAERVKMDITTIQKE